MRNYILRIRPYDCMFDDAKGITQRRYMQGKIENFINSMPQTETCLNFASLLSDGTILVVFEHSQSGYLREWFIGEFDKLFKCTDGYELEVCEVE